MPLDDFIIHIYLFVEDYFKGQRRLRRRGPLLQMLDDDNIDKAPKI